MFSKANLDKLINQPMSRRDFLRNIGLLMLSATGLNTAMHIFANGHHHNKTSVTRTIQNDHHFGRGSFGS